MEKIMKRPKKCGSCGSKEFELIDGLLICYKCDLGSWHE
jgi:hypothetical protein